LRLADNAFVRIAVVSDIHANLTALEAVVADLERQRPDLVVQGGDLISGGSRPAEVIDRVRDLNWPGVYGNTDEMVWAPDRLETALQAPAFARMQEALLTEIIPATRAAIGETRLAWLQTLPPEYRAADLAVVHASPGDVWRSPAANATDDELDQAYRPLSCGRVVFGHIHQSFVRRLPGLTVVNAGSVSLSYDGDPRAAYAIIEDDNVVIRRVEYDVEEEIACLVAARDPYAQWTAQVLRAARPAPFP
jgi:predicted phosphodiesterase